MIVQGHRSFLSRNKPPSDQSSNFLSTSRPKRQHRAPRRKQLHVPLVYRHLHVLMSDQTCKWNSAEQTIVTKTQQASSSLLPDLPKAKHPLLQPDKPDKKHCMYSRLNLVMTRRWPTRLQQHKPSRRWKGSAQQLSALLLLLTWYLVPHVSDPKAFRTPYSCSCSMTLGCRPRLLLLHASIGCALGSATLSLIRMTTGTDTYR